MRQPDMLGISVSLRIPSKQASMHCTLPVSHFPKPRRSAVATEPQDEKSRSSDTHSLVSIFPKSNDSQRVNWLNHQAILSGLIPVSTTETHKTSLWIEYQGQLSNGQLPSYVPVSNPV